jgi:lipopolysaccharide export system permease protein
VNNGEKVEPVEPVKTVKKYHIISGTVFRYILIDAFFSFFVAFSFFFVVFFLNQLLLMAQDVLSKKVPFYQVALLVIYALPQVVSLSAPFGSLVGTLMTVGRLTSDNEILVMLSSGLSYFNIFIPALVMGIIISLFSFVVNDIFLPIGTVQLNILSRQIAVSTPAVELGSYSVKKFRDTVIVTGNVDGSAIEDICILDRSGSRERRIIVAERAEVRDSGSKGLNLDLTNAFVHSSQETERSNYDYATSTMLSYWIPQEDIVSSTNSISPREMSSVDVYHEIRDRTLELNAKIDEQYNRILLSGLALEETLRKGSQHSLWNRRRAYKDQFIQDTESARFIAADWMLNSFWVEFHKKFTLPFGAFSFVFLAVTLGLFAKKSGQMVGFFFGVIIAVIYWSMMFVGQTMARRLGYSPFWMMWLPDILSLVIGMALTLMRVRK